MAHRRVALAGLSAAVSWEGGLTNLDYGWFVLH